MPTPETTAREALRAAIAAVSGMIVDADAVVRHLEARGFTVAMLLPSGQTPWEKCEAAGSGTKSIRSSGKACQAMANPETTEPARCLSCHWWGLRDSSSVPEANRQCHRFPPIATRDADGEMMSEWPWTNQRDYCGEHRAYD